MWWRPVRHVWRSPLVMWASTRAPGTGSSTCPSCLGCSRFWALGEAVPAGALDLRRALAQTTAWNAAQMRTHMQAIGLSAHDVFTICWTSGTEARPKGVPRNHNEWLIIGQSVMDAGQLQRGAQMVIPVPFVNMAGISTSLMAWLMSGGGLHQHHPFDMDVFVQQLREQAIDYSVAAPAVLNLMLKQPRETGWCGSEPTSAHWLRRGALVAVDGAGDGQSPRH